MKFVANRYADPVKAGKTNVADVPTIDMGTADATIFATNTFTFYIAWASTEASCKAICYDAVDGKAKITLYSQSAQSVNWHGWDVYWVRRFMQQNTANCAVGDYGHNSGDTGCGTWDTTTPTAPFCPTTTTTDSSNKV